MTTNLLKPHFISCEHKDLKASFDALHKESVKKDAKIDSMMKELIAVRAATSNSLVSELCR